MVSYESYKRVRNRLRRVHALSLIEACVQRLHAVHRGGFELYRQSPPWLLLLIIKWTLQDGTFHGSHATQNDFAEIVNAGHRLMNMSGLRPEQSKQGLRLFMKTIAYQQFWLQQRISVSHVGRLVSLFEDSDRRGFIQTRFAQLTGHTVQAFCEFAFALASRFLSDEGAIEVSRSYFRPFDMTGRGHSVDAFLRMISLSPEEARGFLNDADRRVRDFDSRLYEQTPLKMKPLLRLDERYVCYSPNVLLSNLTNLIYDSLKAADSAGFCTEFGPVFEHYVGRLIGDLGRPFLTEADIQEAFGRRSAVDFLIPESDAAVMVECKGIELSPFVGVSSNADVVAQGLRDSVSKAVVQSSVVAALPWGGRSAKTFFALIVTYKPLWLGSGSDYLSGALKAELTARCKAYGVALLPPENFVFLSVDDFELLCSVSEQTGVAISAILREFQTTQCDFESRVLTIGQFLGTKYPAGRASPRIVESAFDAFTQRLEARIDAGTNAVV